MKELSIFIVQYCSSELWSSTFPPNVVGAGRHDQIFSTKRKSFQFLLCGQKDRQTASAVPFVLCLIDKKKGLGRAFSNGR